MKKEYHGFRIEKVKITSEAVIVSSVGQCAYTYNYHDTNGVEYDSPKWNQCTYSESEIQIVPYYYGNQPG